MESKVKN